MKKARENPDEETNERSDEILQERILRATRLGAAIARPDADFSRGCWRLRYGRIIWPFREVDVSWTMKDYQTMLWTCRMKDGLEQVLDTPRLSSRVDLKEPQYPAVPELNNLQEGVDSCAGVRQFGHFSGMRGTDAAHQESNMAGGGAAQLRPSRNIPHQPLLATRRLNAEGLILCNLSFDHSSPNLTAKIIIPSPDVGR